MNNYFTVYEPSKVEPVKYKLPLMDDEITLPWAQSILNKDDNSPGTIIVRNNLQDIVDFDNPPQQEYVEQKIPSIQYNPDAKGAKYVSQVIDEVSNEPGFEGLKDPEVKKLLMLQASRESSFNFKINSPQAGCFQFTDATRKDYSSFNRQDFLNDPKEQVRAAYRMYKHRSNFKSYKELLKKGYNKAQVTALAWWLPASMDMLLNGQKNHSEGGYSITKALAQYKNY